MENYQKAYGLRPDRDLPPTPSTYNSLPIRGEETKPKPDTDEGSQAESTSGSIFFGGRLFGGGGEDRKTAKERLKDKVREKRERLRNQRDITPHSNSLPTEFYDLSTSSSLTGVGEGGPHHHHHHDGQESVKTTWSQKHKKKVRIVCISDTHNQTPARLPPGDVLIHAGDLTNSGTYKELSRAAEWLRNLKGYEYKIVIPGNHELGLDRSWVEDFGYEIGVGLKEEECLGEGKQAWEDCVELFQGEEARDRGVVYLGPAPGDYDHRGGSRTGNSDTESIAGTGDESREDESKVRIPGKMKELRLSSGVKFTVWGCPALPRIFRSDLSKQEALERVGTSANLTTYITRPKRRWAFGYSTPISLEESCWADIPASGIDILVTHVPPKYHLDSHDSSSLPASGASPRESSTVQAGLERATFLGCEFLRQALWRTRPKLHVFGHVHEGRGAQVVRWDTDSRWIRWREGRVVEWIEPGGSKMSLVDLTGRGRGRAKDWKVVVDEGKGVGGGVEKGSSKPGTIASDETSRHTPDGWPRGYNIDNTSIQPTRSISTFENTNTQSTRPRPRPQYQPGQSALSPPKMPDPDTPPPSIHAPVHPSVLPSIQPSTQPSIFKPKPSQSLKPPSISHYDTPPLMSSSTHATHHSHQPSIHNPTITNAETASSITTITPAPTPAPALLPGQETCLVNASYVTSSYYSRGAAHAAASRAASVNEGSRKGKVYGGGKRANGVNKPIVVDLELEVEAGWLEEREREMEEGRRETEAKRREDRRRGGGGGGGNGSRIREEGLDGLWDGMRRQRVHEFW